MVCLEWGGISVKAYGQHGYVPAVEVKRSAPQSRSSRKKSARTDTVKAEVGQRDEKTRHPSIWDIKHHIIALSELLFRCTRVVVAFVLALAGQVTFFFAWVVLMSAWVLLLLIPAYYWLRASEVAKAREMRVSRLWESYLNLLMLQWQSISVIVSIMSFCVHLTASDEFPSLHSFYREFSWLWVWANV